ncbi:hypothetical protein H5410_063089 [Solanum commersonii]|uniref:Uncharacterized protein n=1 Tax=Solanum commersonii TaxID=4109 RepID=A0A9J5WC96_SOLCO|nr:hypothetical protein H5410_063089 [Solanum commersonii]
MSGENNLNLCWWCSWDHRSLKMLPCIRVISLKNASIMLLTNVLDLSIGFQMKMRLSMPVIIIKIHPSYLFLNLRPHYPQELPRKRKGSTSGTKPTDRFR